MIYLGLCAPNIFAQQFNPKKIYDYQSATYKLIFSEPKHARDIIDSLISVHQKWPDSLKANNFKNKAILNATQNDLDAALYYFKQSLAHLKMSQDRYPEMLSNIAVIYKRQNLFEEAFKAIDLGDSIAKAQSNFVALGLLAGQRSTCYTRLQNYTLAIGFQKEAIAYFEKTNDFIEELLIEKHNLANLYMESGNYRIAKNSFEQLIPQLKEKNRLSTYYLAHLNLSKCHIALGNESQADSLIQYAKSGLKTFGNTNFLSYADELKAELLVKQKEYSAASQLYDGIIKAALVHNNERLYSIAAKYINTLALTGKLEDARILVQQILKLSEIQNSKRFGLMDQIEFYKQVTTLMPPNNGTMNGEIAAFKQLTVLQDSLHQITNFTIKKQLSLEYEKQLKEKDNIILAKKIENEKKTSFSLLVSLLLVSLGLLFLVNYYRQKHKIRAIEMANLANEEQILKSKLKIEKELNEFRQREIEKKKAEMMALNIEHTKTVNKFIEFTHKFDENTQQIITEKFSELSPNDKYLDKIQQKFKQLNPHFIFKLKELYPQISNVQIDFCSLIKMRFDNKAIADILNITHETVITKKYRLKKKMKLQKDIDFTSFIEAL
ncbi:hypothetical protein [Winogradskyella sp.]|uniref:hypothetical protein n=1 Tax=Winogradskyella sp. TaxID=1883156 RepID=UPI003F6BEC0F